MTRRLGRFGTAFVLILLLAGCASEEGFGMTSDRGRSELDSVAAIITASVGDGWTRAAGPSTVACGTLTHAPGRRWIDTVRGQVAGIGSSVLADAAAALSGAELEITTRLIGDPVDIIELVGGSEQGLTAVLTLSASGTAWLDVESACFPE